jgi:hypothetical protein
MSANGWPSVVALVLGVWLAVSFTAACLYVWRGTKATRIERRRPAAPVIPLDLSRKRRRQAHARRRSIGGWR